jgi:CRISPR-associated exonuclease Cas4
MRLGLIGRADVVEFRGDTPYPVEYKHGPARRGRHADVQVCAQALCLEEMLGVPVPRGAVYHFTSRKRREVTFTPGLRDHVREMIAAARRALQQERLPPPVNDARCRNCSLVQSCMPGVVADEKHLAAQWARLFRPAALREGA